MVNVAIWLSSLEGLVKDLFCGRGVGVGPGVVPVSKYCFCSSKCKPPTTQKH